MALKSDGLGKPSLGKLTYDSTFATYRPLASSRSTFDTLLLAWIKSMEPFVGQIQLLPYNFAPAGWAFCEGQLLGIRENMALFSLIGTNYGGDGKVNFALPDLKGREPDPNMHYCIALTGIFPSRQ